MYIHLYTYTCIIYRAKHISPGRCYAAGNLLFKALTLQPRLRHLRRLRFGRLINRVRTILQLRETVLKVSRSVTRVPLEGSRRFMVHEWLIHFHAKKPVLSYIMALFSKILNRSAENYNDYDIYFFLFTLCKKKT